MQSDSDVATPGLMLWQLEGSARVTEPQAQK